ncbi:MAG TPA: hypothetical protein H9895_06420 [Candidatus Pseudogracilibacillus intestinigallinarum]|uniref:Lipoprotein n=1 Tax=Candidatus Pseudogracilibacillus intestinigallinarum TaxID=2838742 RepID=A0A9D1PNP5_9BACI|nr:hypothetical protein [Candidatus Pseudogracilibacillus intestinigallinarum]
MKNITVFTIALFLVACGGQLGSSKVESVEIDDTQVESNEVVNDASENEANEVANNENEGKDKETLTNEYKESLENEDTTKISDDLKALEEFATLEEEINLSEAQIEIIEDNYGKRILLIKDAEGNKTHKSIFSKKVSKLKIIEFDGGQIFNEVIE